METAFFSGGSQQIRTAVDGFADRYLTTRSGNHFRFALQRYKKQLLKRTVSNDLCTFATLKK